MARIVNFSRLRPSIQRKIIQQQQKKGRVITLSGEIKRKRRTVKRRGETLAEFVAAGGRVGSKAKTIADIERGKLRVTERGKPTRFTVTKRGVATERAAKTLLRPERLKLQRQQERTLKRLLDRGLRLHIDSNLNINLLSPELNQIGPRISLTKEGKRLLAIEKLKSRPGTKAIDLITGAMLQAKKKKVIPFKDLTILEKIERNLKLKKGQTLKDIEKITGKKKTGKFDLLKKLREKPSPEMMKRKVNTLSKQATLVLLGAARAPVSVVKTFINPKETARNLVKAIKQPTKVIKGLKEEFIMDPAGTVTEFIVFGQILNKIARLTKSSAIGAKVTEELFLLSKVPKILRVDVRKILNAVRAQQRISPSTKLIKKVSFLEVENLTKVEAIAVKKALQQTDSIVFGTAASRVVTKGRSPIPKDIDFATASISKFNKKFIESLPRNVRQNYKIIDNKKILRTSELRGLTARQIAKKPGLFDIKELHRLVRGPLPAPGLIRKFTLPTKLSNVFDMAKRIIRLRKDISKRGTLTKIENIGKQLKKGLKDIKVSDLPKSQRKIIDNVSEILDTLPTIKIEGIKFIGFPEQVTRKALGTLQVLIEKNVRRAKDPQALLNNLQIQIETLKAIKPKTKFGLKLRNNRIKIINDAIEVLTSKRFSKLLESKVPGLTKQYPLFKKINISKLKNIKKQPISKIKKFIEKKKPKGKKKFIKKTKKFIKKKPKIKRKVKIKKKRPSKVPKKRPSRIPPSRAPRFRPSKITPSRVPKRKPSKVPSKAPSRKPSKAPSKAPSRVPSIIPRRIPSKVPSKPPSIKPSKAPSKAPSRIPSKVPGKKPSKFSGRQRRKKPPIKTIRRLKKEKKKFIKKSIGYNVIIREEGRRLKANIKLLPRKKAARLLKGVLDNTVAGSGRLIKGKKKIPISRKALVKIRKKTPTSKFRAGRTKKTRDLIVEKRGHRIDTIGEKEGLSAAKFIAKLKGQARKRRKGKK